MDLNYSEFFNISYLDLDQRFCGGYKCRNNDFTRMYPFRTHLVFYFSVDTLSEDEEDDIIVSGCGEGISINAMPTSNSATNFTPTPGGPFSALTPSMWPQDIISRINHPVSICLFFYYFQRQSLLTCHVMNNQELIRIKLCHAIAASAW